MRNAYIGLLRCDGTEPPSGSGYARADPGDIGNQEIVFPAVNAPGYGVVTDYGLFERPYGGAPLRTWSLSEPVNVHPGTVPVIHNGRLLLGVDVTAQIAAQSYGEEDVD